MLTIKMVSSQCQIALPASAQWIVAVFSSTCCVRGNGTIHEDIHCVHDITLKDSPLKNKVPGPLCQTFCHWWLPLLKIQGNNDKTNTMTCAHREDSDLPSLIRAFAVGMYWPWVLSFLLSTQRRLWSDWANGQAYLSVHWAHKSFCWFCRAAAQSRSSLSHLFAVMILIFWTVYLTFVDTVPLASTG